MAILDKFKLKKKEDKPKGVDKEKADSPETKDTKKKSEKKPKEVKKTDKKESSEKVQKEVGVSADSHHHIIKRPRITEKAAILSGDGVYTFEIHPDATKIDVARAIKAIYKMEPRKVSISKLPAKKKFVRGKKGKTSAVKKAIVYLKKGDTIEFV